MQDSSTSTSPSTRLTFLLATAVGLLAANLYYAQPLVGMISRALGIPPEYAGLVVTLTQAGYGIGVLLLVPLGDMLENRRLILTMITVTFFGLLGLAFVQSTALYFSAALITGIGASTVQMIVPYAVHLAVPERRGRLTGTLMSGLMIGIMLSRPSASLLADWFSWHAIFLASAALTILLGLALARRLAPRTPPPLGLSYGQLIASMGRLFMDTPVLRRRAIYQACCFAAFCVFWTASPLLLSGPEFQFSQTAIAIFALVGVSGAISAPFAGRAADRGLLKPATTVALTVSACSFLLPHIFPMGGTASLIMMVLSAVLLDAGITANLVLGQRAIFSLNPEIRSRLNGLYIATIFVGGAIGSALGVWTFEHGGWWLTSWAGFALPGLAYLYFLTERRSA